MKCRIVYKPDGTVSVIHPVSKARKPKETEAAFLKRVFGKAVKGTELEGLPYDDVEPSSLPQDRKDRDKWRGKKGEGIKVDSSIITIAEKRQAIENELDAELAKAAPDPVQVIKLERKLQKRDY